MPGKTFSVVSILEQKRDAKELSDDEISAFIRGVTENTVSDEQIAAFAMAVCCQGMTKQETATLTDSMSKSGAQLPGSETPRLDKHSTGGLGDKVSLVFAPLVAAIGYHVPMISGRGLGITGGTLDKLESIPGFRVDYAPEQTQSLLETAGCFIISAGQDIAPADRRIYAVRDITGTVPSEALITASILSKKIAANLDALVMDVKVGSGATITTMDEARRVADSLIRVGHLAGLPTSALITDMDQPLGSCVGNINEVQESIAILQGKISEFPPAQARAMQQVGELSVELAAKAISTAKLDSESSAKQRLCNALECGAGYESFARMVSVQEGTLKHLSPPHKGVSIQSSQSGFVQFIDARTIGEIVRECGGGRRQRGDQIDPLVGVTLKAKVGDYVESGQELAEFHVPKSRHGDYADRLIRAFKLDESPPDSQSLVFEVRNE